MLLMLCKNSTYAYHITIHVVFIADNKDHIKSGQDCWHEVDVLGTLSVIPTSINAVGRSEHGAARVQSCGDSSLINHTQHKHLRLSRPQKSPPF